jgi:formate hydrogenlyase subunit 6/NADH:ubiquinone oxidoreductase subunit I
MNFLSLFARNLIKGPYTDPFPFAPAPTAKRFRGKITFDATHCEGCRQCEKVCPAGAIRFTRSNDGLDSCVFCGNCEFHCPTDAIHQSTDWHLAHRQADKFSLVEHGLIPFQTCPDCGGKGLDTAPATARVTPPLSAEETVELRARCPKCRAKYLKARRNRT